MLNDATSPDQAAQQMQNSATATPPAPAEAAIATTPAQTPPAAPAATPPAAAPAAAAPTTAQPPARRGGILGVLDAVTNMLANPNTTNITYDDAGRHVTPGKPLSRGEQLAQIALEGLTGASRAMAVPPGPGHTGQGVAAATLGGIQDVKDAAAAKDSNAQQAYEAQQKAKMNNITYQLGIRQIAKSDLELKAAGVKAGEDSINFSNTQIDREKQLGSYDLGVVKDAGEIADTISKLPNWQQQLYQHESVQPIPVYAPDGTRIGLQLYLRKPDVDNVAAPEGLRVPKWVPGSKPGEPPHTEYFTPVGATNGQIDKYNRGYLADVQAYQKQQSEENLKTEQAKTQASVRTKNYADADKSTADAAKARQEATNANVDSPQVMQIGEGIARGNLTEDQVPGFSKLKPAIQAYLTQHHPNLDQKSVFLTGEERKRVDLATNAIHNLDDIATRLQRRPDLIGKIQGRVTQGKEVIGTDDRDLGDILVALDNYALASTGAHGIRAVQARADAKQAFLNNFKNGPNAVDAAMKAARGSLQNLASAGKPRGVDGSPYAYSTQPQGSPAAAHATATTASAAPAAAAPQTHVFSPKAWAAANPGKDVNAAINQAKQQGYQIGQQ